MWNKPSRFDPIPASHSIALHGLRTAASVLTFVAGATLVLYLGLSPG